MTIIASVPVPARHRLIDAPTADMAAIRRPVDQAEQARRAWEAITGTSTTTVAVVAAKLGVTPAEAYELARHHIAAQTGWTPEQKRQAVTRIPGDPKLCPAWCTKNHTEEGAERYHAHEVGEVVAPSGPDMHDRQVISVQLDAFESPEMPGGIDPTSIFLVVSGECDAESTASLSPELAEQLAAALFEAARIARQARR